MFRSFGHVGLNILVTGITGYVGSVLAPRLERDGHALRGLARDPSRTQVSFRLLVRVLERLPVLVVPAWRTNRTAPIDERDIVGLLARAATSEEVCGCSLDAAGPETVAYGELIDRIRDHMLVGRPTIEFRRLT